MKISRMLRSALVLLALAAVLAALTQGTFLTPRNLTNLARQVAINGVLAVGMTYVILVGGIDLSVGSVVALAGVVAGLLQVGGGNPAQAGLGWAALAVLAAVAVGVGTGLFNGLLITRQRIAPFIITLGMMVIARGVALILAKGAAIAPLSDAFNGLGQGYLPVAPTLALIWAGVAAGLLGRLWKTARAPLDYAAAAGTLAMGVAGSWVFTGYRGLPIPVLVFALLGMAGVLILTRTRLGRFVLAIGGNSEAAWLSGVPIRQVTLGVYVAMGAVSGLCGAILAARLNGALPTAGELFELDAIAAVVIGGTSLLGGVGSVQGSILGAFFIGTLNNGMSLLDVTEFYQKVIKGVIIILAVWIDVRQAASGARRGGGKT